MEFLQTNWVWVLLVAGVLWLLFRGGLGCGMGRSHDRARRDRDVASREPGARRGGSRDEAPGNAEHAGHRGHRGC
jgi:hypothetical protein